MKYVANNVRLLFVLVVIFALGMVRVAVTPPWMHYDEASHYDYIHFLITHRALPQRNQPDLSVASYLNTLDPSRRYEISICEPSNDPRKVCWYPAQQFDEMPTYYFLQATIFAITRPATLDGQLGLMRTVSVMLGVGVGAIMYALIKSLFPEQTLLAVSVPLIMGLNFAFTDLMSALNNDVSAILAFHLMIFAMIYIFRHRFTGKSIVLLTVALILCVITKASAWIGVPLAMLGMGIALTPHLRLGQHIGILAVLGVIAMGVVFYWEPGVGPLFRPAIDGLIPVPMGGNIHLVGWYDPANWRFYWPAIRWQLVTFWTAYATGQPGLPISGVAIYGVMMVASGLGLVRLALTRGHSLTHTQAQSMLFLIIALALALIMSLIRIDPPFGGVIYYIPTARHFYIVAGPTMMLFLLGLSAWIAPKYQRAGLALLILGLYALSVWSLLEVQFPWFAPYV